MFKPTRRGAPAQERRPIEDPAGRVLYYVLLPAWGLPGLVDWWFHRRTHIEEPENGGVRESALHLLMLAEGAVPIGLALLAEINPLSLAMMTASAIVHEATASWDLSVATQSNRHVGPAEQQVHSFLETIPFGLVVLAGIHAWPSLKSNPGGSRWALRAKVTPLPLRYVAGVALSGALLGALPHAEEFWRCVRRAMVTETAA